MAVTVTVAMDADEAAFVPYRIPQRGGDRGTSPVGTVNVDAQVVGAAGGGQADVLISASQDMWGFRPVIVPVVVSFSDNLATAENVLFFYNADGNERLVAAVGQIVVMTTVLGTNAGLPQTSSIPITPDVIGSGAAVMKASWASNVDTKVYHMHVFAAVYDREVLARTGEIPDFLAGIR